MTKQSPNEQLARLCHITPKIKVKHFSLFMFITGKQPECEEVFPEFEGRYNIQRFYEMLAHSPLQNTKLCDLMSKGAVELCLEYLRNKNISEENKEKLIDNISGRYWKYEV